LSFNRDGSLNRGYLSSTVFNDEDKLSKLNGLIHPRVAVDYRQWVKREQRSPYLIKEAAILFETNSSKVLHKTIVVSAPEDLRIKRVLIRDTHRTEEAVRQIMDKQMPEEEKLKRADFVVINDETELLIPRVLELHNRFLSITSLTNFS